jgi:hypothetical protein
MRRGNEEVRNGNLYFQLREMKKLEGKIAIDKDKIERDRMGEKKLEKKNL